MGSQTLSPSSPRPGRRIAKCEDLFEQAGQLRFAKDAARFHVGQQVLEVAHALRQRVHFTQAAMHLLQPFGHLPEALAQALLQRGLQFFIDGAAHFVQFFGVALLQTGQLLLQGAAHFLQAAGVVFAQRLQLRGQRVGQRFLQQGQLLGEGVYLRVLRAGGFGVLAGDGLLKGGERVQAFLPPFARALGDLLAQFALQAHGGFTLLLRMRGSLCGSALGQQLHVLQRRRIRRALRPAQQHGEEQRGIQHTQGQGGPEKKSRVVHGSEPVRSQ